MDLTALLLSRLQFAFTISFHIIFPSFTIGLAAWLTVLEALGLATRRPVYRVVFEFWLKIFGVAFGLGVVSGVVMGFQFGTNWSVFAAKVGPIQGVLLSYETFTAFFLEASFFGILLFGRSRVPPWFYLFSTAMVALGTTFSAFWIMVNNSWMQAPVGYATANGQFAPDDWAAIIFSPVVWVRFPHMLLASYLTGASCVAGTGAWYLLRGEYHAEARIMLRMGLFLGAVLVPAQLFFGHLVGDYVHDKQPEKFAAIEGRWHDEQPASEVLIALPDAAVETNHYAISVPDPWQLDRQHELHFEGSWSHRFPGPGPAAGGDPILCVPHHGRLRSVDAVSRLVRFVSQLQGTHRRHALDAVGDLSWLSTAVDRDPHRLVHRRGRAATLDHLRCTAHRPGRHAVTDGARSDDLAPRGLLGLQLHLRVRHPLHLPAAAQGARGAADQAACRRPSQPADVRRRPSHDHRRASGRMSMIMFWVAVLAISILLYVLLDGFDLGVGILFGMARDDGRRATMLSAVSPVWDGNETWLVVTAVVLWGAFPPVYAALLSAFYLPLY